VSECVLVCVCGYKAHTTYIFCILLKILIKYNTYTLTHSHTHITHTPITHTNHTHSHSHTHTQTHTQTHLSSVVNCVDTNSAQFNADRYLFTSIRRLGSKKIHLVSNSTRKASNCMFKVVYGKFTPI